MKDKKNIDRLFQEKLKDFEAHPPEMIWNSIEAKLPRKKRKIVPLWWVYGGAAASLIIGLLMTITPSKKREVFLENEMEMVTTPSKKKSESVVPKNKKLAPSLPIENVPKESSIIAKTIPHKNKSQVKTTIVKSKKNTKIGLAATDKYVTNTISKIKTGTTSEDAQKKLKPTENLNKREFPKKNLIAENTKTNVGIETENGKNKWSVSPVFAITNSNSFSNASPLDNTLNEANTSGRNNYSYGVKLAYQLATKWELQSGVLVQNMNFQTTNITVNPSAIGPEIFKNKYLGKTEIPRGFVNIPSATAETSLALDSQSAAVPAQINESISFLEIPVEVAYTFLESRKFRSKIVTGFSSLFLQQNNTNINAENISFSTENKSINSINFSGNIGLDFQYSINPQFELSINPMFKAQLNTFSKESVEFEPYTIGVYTGIIYKF